MPPTLQIAGDDITLTTKRRFMRVKGYGATHNICSQCVADSTYNTIRVPSPPPPPPSSPLNTKTRRLVKASCIDVILRCPSGVNMAHGNLLGGSLPGSSRLSLCASSAFLKKKRKKKERKTDVSPTQGSGQYRNVRRRWNIWWGRRGLNVEGNVRVAVFRQSLTGWWR